MRRCWFILLALLLAVPPGCEDSAANSPEQTRQDRYEKLVQAKYGKAIDELPHDPARDHLVIISPHNRDIKFEFEQAFILHRALHQGRRTTVEWRSVGGGGSQIVRYLANIYDQGVDSSGIDIFWGGGDYYFGKLARRHGSDAPAVLAPMDIPAEVRKQVPATLCGNDMISPENLWCGAAVSGFGILYNRTLLEWIHTDPPETWDDLGRADLADLVALADPTLSSSVVATFVLIVQSASDWPTGWAKLHAILGNTHAFYGGAGEAANAVVTEAPIATCIDFYGMVRVNQYPQDLRYVPPKGQAVFNADPIAILRNPPHPQLAREFCNFVLSVPGQALWALPVGHPDGPVREALLRNPIRKDVYTIYAGQLCPEIVNPYQIQTATDQKYMSGLFAVLRNLIKAGQIDNVHDLKRARQVLIEKQFPADLVAIWNELPPDLQSARDVAAASKKLSDTTQRDLLTTAWRDFFRAKYQRIIDAGGQP
jgi:iron(III) transport system substrate-binding protein